MNRVELVGRITKDVEVTKTSQQLSLARFTVAVNRRFNTVVASDKAFNIMKNFFECLARSVPVGAWKRQRDPSRPAVMTIRRPDREFTAQKYLSIMPIYWKAEQ